MGTAQNLSTQTIHLAPLQGFTDFRFRNTFHEFYSGVDIYYTPWIKLDSKYQLKKSYLNEIAGTNNAQKVVIPQIMTNSPEEFIYLAKYIYDLGYEIINWNLGCPYPMVAKRGLGSGLLREPKKIISILEKVCNKISNRLSIKTRLGYENLEDLVTIIPTLNNFNLDGIIIHPRTAKQMYKGDIHLDVFEKCIELSSHPIIYNGDIKTFRKFSELKNRFPSINQWMIGRGIISNPFLANMIKMDVNQLPHNAKDTFLKFHESLLNKYSEQLSGEKHILQKMIAFWEYFSQLFLEPHKAYKIIKKSKNIQAYNSNVYTIVQQGLGFKP